MDGLKLIQVMEEADGYIQNMLSPNTMKVISFIITIFLVFACSDRAERSINSPVESIRSIKSKVFKGDIISYNKLKTVYLDSSPEGFLFWAMLMSNRFNYADAHMDVYECVLDGYSREGLEGIGALDFETKEMLKKYLRRASDQGVLKANVILIELEKNEEK